MRVYFDQIPKGYSIQDYPKDTKFVLDDSKPKRDPVTFKLIPPKKRPLIYPDDCK